jgi:DNA recombination protein RmuC
MIEVLTQIINDIFPNYTFVDYTILVLIIVSSICFLSTIFGRISINKLKNQLYCLTKDLSISEEKNRFYENSLREKIEEQKSLDQKLQDFLRNQAQDVLLKNQTSFMEMAKTTFDQIHQNQKHDLDTRQTAISQMILPVNQTLSKMDEKLNFLEKERTVAYVDLKFQVQSLIETQKNLQQETSSLVKALRNPSTRGQWGEIQLKRVVELAGMIEHCDFVQQETSDRNKLRPDMIVHLPGKKQVIVDAKTPLAAYLNSLEEKDTDKRAIYLVDHARQVKVHIKQLSQKSYWEQFDHTPEFVIMFLPSESLLSAALEYDPTLIEFGAQERVIMATPTTLIALLRAIAYGWRQENVHESVKKIVDLGQDLYKRFHTFNEYFMKLGRTLEQSVNSYNQTLSSVEGRLLPVMRKFQDIKPIKKEENDSLLDLQVIETQTKIPHAMEFKFDE